MASERQLALAANLAAGMDGYGAALSAGWPATTAVLIARNPLGYLAKAGIEVQFDGGVVKAATEPDPAPEAETEVLRIEATVADEATDPEPVADAKRARGRPKKEA